MDLMEVNGTPVLDIKPYVAYSDAHPTAGAGWLERQPRVGAAPQDPGESFTVTFDDLAAELSHGGEESVFRRQRFAEHPEIANLAIVREIAIDVVQSGLHC